MSTVTTKKMDELTTLFDYMDEPCLVFDVNDPDFTILAQNHAHQRMSMTLDKQVVGKSVFLAFPDTSEEYRLTGSNALIRSLKRVLEQLEGDKMPLTEYDIADETGHLVHKVWRISHQPLFNEDGSIYAILQNSRDVTDLSDAEQKLQQTESSIQAITNAIPQLLWVSHADGTRKIYNEQWYSYTGTDISAMAKKTWRDLLHKDDKPTVDKNWESSLQHGKPYETECRLYHAPSNSYRWILVRATPLRNSQDNILRWYGTCTDIHDQKHSAEVQRLLSDVSKELSSTLDYDEMLKKVSQLCVPALADWCTIDLYDEHSSSFNQVSVAHSDPHKVSLAVEYRQHNPVTPDQTTGVPQVVRTGKSEVYKQITDAMLEASLDDNERLAFMKSLNLHSIVVAPLSINSKPVGGITFISADSEYYYDESDVAIIEELAGRVSLAMTNSWLYTQSQQELVHRKTLQKQLVLEKQKLESRVIERTQQLQLTNEGLREEITKRQKAEDELETYSNELARSNEELENFAYIASHDLQEPLRKIQAFGNLLQSEYESQLGEDGKNYLERMQSAAARMSTLIDDLLTFSRVGRRDSKVKSTDLNKISSEVISDLETAISAAHATITVSTLPTVHADPTHMRQLLQNLIGNAIKFRDADRSPHIAITAKEHGDTVEIRVKDNGIGFEEQYKDRIFSVFQRLHARKKYEGTGIGLAVCRKIVEKYHGTINVTSKKDVGTTFIVCLPLPTKDAAQL